MMSRIENLKQRRFIPKKASARFLVFWQKEDRENEIKILLPEICFERLEE